MERKKQFFMRPIRVIGVIRGYSFYLGSWEVRVSRMIAGYLDFHC